MARHASIERTFVAQMSDKRQGEQTSRERQEERRRGDMKSAVKAAKMTKP